MFVCVCCVDCWFWLLWCCCWVCLFSCILCLCVCCVYVSVFGQFPVAVPVPVSGYVCFMLLCLLCGVCVCVCVALWCCGVLLCLVCLCCVWCGLFGCVAACFDL